MTALIMASGYIKLVEKLLKRGANANIMDKVSSTKAVRCLLRQSTWFIAVGHQTFCCSASWHEVEQENVW